MRLSALEQYAPCILADVLLVTTRSGEKIRPSSWVVGRFPITQMTPKGHPPTRVVGKGYPPRKRAAYLTGWLARAVARPRRSSIVIAVRYYCLHPCQKTQHTTAEEFVSIKTCGFVGFLQVSPKSDKEGAEAVPLHLVHQKLPERELVPVDRRHSCACGVSPAPAPAFVVVGWGSYASFEFLLVFW